jgi:hypothetical protein
VEISFFLGQRRDAWISLLPYFWERRNFPSWERRGRRWGDETRRERGRKETEGREVKGKQ